MLKFVFLEMKLGKVCVVGGKERVCSVSDQRCVSRLLGVISSRRLDAACF